MDNDDNATQILTNGPKIEKQKRKRKLEQCNGTKTLWVTMLINRNNRFISINRLREKKETKKTELD